MAAARLSGGGLVRAAQPASTGTNRSGGRPMPNRMSIAGVAFGLWLLTLVLVGGCGLGQPAPTPTAPATPPPVTSPAAATASPRPPLAGSPSPSPSPSPVVSGRQPWTVNTLLVVVDPQKDTADAGVRLRSRASLGEDDRALTLYDGDEVRVISATPERVVQSGTGKEYYFWQVRVEKGDQGAIDKTGWVADEFLRAK